MNLIEQEEVFRQKVLEIESVVNIQIQLPKQVFHEKFTSFRVLDFDEIYSESFFQTMNNFLKHDKSSKWTFAVLNNDPEDFFFRHCKRYPIFEVSSHNAFEGYLSITRGDLECIPDESLADNAYIIVLYPESLNWVIYGDFDFEIAIVGFQDNSFMESFIS